MNPDRIKSILSEAFTYPPETAQEAQTFLRNYENGFVQIPDENMSEVYGALQDLICQGMGASHDNDVKRQQRSQGKNRRKARTGSRR